MSRSGDHHTSHSDLISAAMSAPVSFFPCTSSNTSGKDKTRGIALRTFDIDSVSGAFRSVDIGSPTMSFRQYSMNRVFPLPACPVTTRSGGPTLSGYTVLLRLFHELKRGEENMKSRVSPIIALARSLILTLAVWPRSIVWMYRSMPFKPREIASGLMSSAVRIRRSPWNPMISLSSRLIHALGQLTTSFFLDVSTYPDAKTTPGSNVSSSIEVVWGTHL